MSFDTYVVLIHYSFECIELYLHIIKLNFVIELADLFTHITMW